MISKLSFTSASSQRDLDLTLHRPRLLFTSKPGVKVTIKVEIHAETQAGFDESTQRAVLENTRVLKFINRDFD